MKHHLFTLVFGCVFASGALGESHSMSCSYVNGKRKCQESHDATGTSAAAGSAVVVSPFGSGTYEGAATGDDYARRYQVSQSSSGIFAHDDAPNPEASENRDSYAGDTNSGDSGESDSSNPRDFDGPLDSPPFGFYVPPPAHSGYFGYPGYGVAGGFAGPGVRTFAGVGGPFVPSAFAGAGVPFGAHAVASAGGFPFNTGTFAFASKRRRR